MIEVEMKFQIDDAELIKKRLEDCGVDTFDPHYDHIVDVYYNSPPLVPGEPTLRVRQYKYGREWAGAVTLKKKMKGTLVREEFEEGIDTPNDVEAILRLFRFFGYDIKAIIGKDRYTYKWDDINVSIDHVEGLGTFVEIEKVVEGQGDADKAIDEIGTVAKHLSLNPLMAIPCSYLELKMNGGRGL